MKLYECVVFQLPARKTHTATMVRRVTTIFALVALILIVEANSPVKMESARKSLVITCLVDPMPNVLSLTKQHIVNVIQDTTL